jgi:uncharacterized membrane protein YgcG
MEISCPKKTVSLSMRCPYCQGPLQASAPECPACRLSYPRASTLLGAVPRIAPLVADTTQTLDASNQARIKQRLARMQQRFPELVPQIVMHAFPEAHPFTLHVFWLFNAADFAGTSRRGYRNHALLLAIDPARAEAAIMPGYGLEDLLTEETMTRILDAAAFFFRQGRWVDGILSVLDELEVLLESGARPLDVEAAVPGEF